MSQVRPTYVVNLLVTYVVSMPKNKNAVKNTDILPRSLASANSPKYSGNMVYTTPFANPEQNNSSKLIYCTLKII